MRFQRVAMRAFAISTISVKLNVPSAKYVLSEEWLRSTVTRDKTLDCLLRPAQIFRWTRWTRRLDQPEAVAGKYIVRRYIRRALGTSFTSFVTNLDSSLR
jgi:hypothetical protein